jgi:hypothetical protein
MKRATFLMTIGAIGGCIVGLGLTGLGAQETKRPTTMPKDEFIIEKFDFEWIVVESGEAKLIVNKTHETTSIILRGGGMMGNSLRFSPADTEAIGKALADVDKYFAKMRNAEKDVDEKVEVGAYRVTFGFEMKYGFHVYVAPKEQFSMSSVSLDRSQAKAFAPHMQKAKAMAAYVDKKVKF